MVRNIGLGAPWNLEPCLELSINRGQAVTGGRLQCTAIYQYSAAQYNVVVQCSAIQLNTVQQGVLANSRTLKCIQDMQYSLIRTLF